MTSVRVDSQTSLLTRFVRSSLLLGWCGCFLVAVLSWMFPIEAAQAWAVTRAGQDDFSRYEAFVVATISIWVIRAAVSAVATLLTIAWLKRRVMIPFLERAVSEFWNAAAPEADALVDTSIAAIPPPTLDSSAFAMDGRSEAIRPVRPILWQRLRRTIPRLIIMAWLLLSAVHVGLSVQRRIWDWPVYGLRSGIEVLPNISGTNREVIRYLQETTPPGSRILVFSDQKLYFLSYYLLPRRIYHPMHPDSEFVIAQAFNQRELAAYRVSDIDPARIRKLNPDYILEYFEGATHLVGENLMRDRLWVEFERRRHGPDWRPPFLVHLQPVHQTSVP